MKTKEQAKAEVDLAEAALEEVQRENQALVNARGSRWEAYERAVGKVRPNSDQAVIARAEALLSEVEALDRQIQEVNARLGAAGREVARARETLATYVNENERWKVLNPAPRASRR